MDRETFELICCFLGFLGFVGSIIANVRLDSIEKIVDNNDKFDV